jgi:glycolate oxidase FAD binding subunit
VSVAADRTAPALASDALPQLCADAAGALVETLRAGLDATVADDDAARRALAIADRVPAVVVRPADVDALAAAVAASARAGAALVPLGRGAHRQLGHAPARYDVALSTARLDRVVEYAPADMTVTVESGLTVSALQAVLAGEGQWLPLDPPLPAETTIGGLVAADLGGGLRSSEGRVRDLLIGIGVVTADGRRARAGGRVVKNVAGYDLMKLFTGSLGTLAVVCEATFKVRPRPALLRCLALTSRDLRAVLTIAERVAEARLALASALVRAVWGDGAAPPMLLCLLAGVAPDVAEQRARLLALAGADVEVMLEADADAPAARALLDPVRDLVRAAPGEIVLRAAALPRRARAVLEGIMGAVPAGSATALLDPRSGAVTVALASAAATPASAAADLARIAEVTTSAGAHLVVERWPPALAPTIQVWSPLPPALPLMRRLKAALDPRGTLAPGRFIGRI